MRFSKTLAAAVFALLYAFPAYANAPQISETVGGQSAFNVSDSLTRPANTTAYTADTAVCQSTSAVCVPLELRLARVNGGTGTITRVWLAKSGSGTTSATFTIFFYAASPTVGTSIKDDVSYTGPYAADMDGYVGSASCTSANTGTDSNVWYECSLSGLGASGLIFKAASDSRIIYALIEATGAYTPTSGETFTVYASGYQD